MPDHVHAWAAAAPDGTLVLDSIGSSEDEVWDAVADEFPGWRFETRKARTQARGWRVVPVEIRVREGGNGE